MTYPNTCGSCHDESSFVPVIDEVSNIGDADHPVIRHKEDMAIEKNINANPDLLLELN